MLEDWYSTVMYLPSLAIRISAVCYLAAILVIRGLQSALVKFGIPQRLVSENGQHFVVLNF